MHAHITGIPCPNSARAKSAMLHCIAGKEITSNHLHLACHASSWLLPPCGRVPNKLPNEVTMSRRRAPPPPGLAVGADGLRALATLVRPSGYSMMLSLDWWYSVDPTEGDKPTCCAGQGGPCRATIVCTTMV